MLIGTDPFFRRSTTQFPRLRGGRLFDQAVSQGLVRPLDPPLRLARIGADDVDVQRIQRAPELGHAVAAKGARLIDPEDAVFVAVERDRLAQASR